MVVGHRSIEHQRTWQKSLLQVALPCGYSERYGPEGLNGFVFSQPSKVFYNEFLIGDQKERIIKVRKLKGVIAKQEERIERLQDNFADGIISSDDFTQMKTRFSEMKRNAVEDLSSMEEDTTGKSVLSH